MNDIENQEPLSQKTYLSVRELQEYLGISRKTAYKLIWDGKIPAYRVSPHRIVISRVDADFYVKSNKIEPCA